jgi:hypothetical protein
MSPPKKPTPESQQGGDGGPLGVRLPTLYTTAPGIARSVFHRCG